MTVYCNKHLASHPTPSYSLIHYQFMVYAYRDGGATLKELS